MKESLKEPTVVARNIARVYGSGSTAVHALRGVELIVEKGTLVALRGRSGSGKTTLLNILGGLDTPSTGVVEISGTNLAALSDDRLTSLRRREFGFVFQAFSLLPTFSAYENVELALRLGGWPIRRRRSRVMELLSIVGLADKSKHRPFELSGGEQQRVSIARSLANSPSILLADEPTGDLDSVTGLGIITLFRRIVDQSGVTAIVATHDPVVSDYADVTYHIVDGRILGINS
ncbi:MAG: ABC transporter ATP-binding protein [Chloroflexi bacterium]|nr:ABC transporter ATP-binding protein [Chloroflexota bacterium]